MEAEFSVWNPAPVDSRDCREAFGAQQVQVWSRVLTQQITSKVVPFSAPLLDRAVFSQALLRANKCSPELPDSESLTSNLGV
jgi:hypothetical protein